MFDKENNQHIQIRGVSSDGCFLLYYNRMNLAMIINREWELKKKVTP